MDAVFNLFWIESWTESSYLGSFAKTNKTKVIIFALLSTRENATNSNFISVHVDLAN